MSAPTHRGFDDRLLLLAPSAILPRRIVTDRQKQSVKYQRIAASIREIGLVEPLVVCRLAESPDQYLLLDGHIRLQAWRERDDVPVRCLLALNDEGLTYNKRISRLATIQEYRMVQRALERGVPEERLARALNVDVRNLRRKRALLDGIAPEVVEILKDRSINPSMFDIIRKMKPLRQIEVADLMSIAGNCTTSYAKALLAATKREDLAHPDKPKRIVGMSAEQMSRLEREMETLQRDYRRIEASYGDEILQLVIAVGYLSKLVANGPVCDYLAKNHAAILEQLLGLVASCGLDQIHNAAP